MNNLLEDQLSDNSKFFRLNYPLVIIALIVSIFIMLGMVIAVLYQVSHKPLPQFNGLALNGKTLPLTSFDEPNYQPATLLRWASKAAVAAYTFDFVNYNKEIAGARPYFTPVGWVDYQDSVSSLISDIAQKQLFVNGVVSGPPIIANEGDIGRNKYGWRVQLPFLVTYQSSEKTSRQDFIVLMTIMKVPTNENPTGIGIDQFVMKGG